MKKMMIAMALLAATPAYALGPDTGERPLHLIKQLKDGPLKEKLLSCQTQKQTPSKFSIGHRGAPFAYPEHTAQSYRAAGTMGAGIIECDVTFTKDGDLVCRHSQKDLHTSTNIVVSKLGVKCTTPFEEGSNGGKARAECRTSDLSTAEFLSLKGKKDGANKTASTAEEYLKEAEPTGTLLTDKQSIALIDAVGADFTPELKRPAVSMPFNGMSQKDYAQKMIEEYKAAGISPDRVWPQFFNFKDIEYWIKNEPEFAKQAIFLDARYRKGIDPQDPGTFYPDMAALKAKGLNYLAPPLWMLVTTENGKIVPSAYAIEAKKAGLKLITWTLERSGPLEKTKGGWYYQSITDLVENDGATYELLHVLAQDVGVVGVFSDWPETVTYYANCFGLK